MLKVKSQRINDLIDWFAISIGTLLVCGGAGLISREEALRLEAQYDGIRPKSLDGFLKEIGMTEEEFNQLTRKHIVSRSEFERESSNG